MANNFRPKALQPTANNRKRMRMQMEYQFIIAQFCERKLKHDRPA